MENCNSYLSITEIQKYKEKTRDCFAPLHREVINAFVYGLSQLPASDVQRVLHGMWLKTENYYAYKCSCCGYITRQPHDKYCSECGAKMYLEE